MLFSALAAMCGHVQGFTDYTGLGDMIVDGGSARSENIILTKSTPFVQFPEPLGGLCVDFLMKRGYGLLLRDQLSCVEELDNCGAPIPICRSRRRRLPKFTVFLSAVKCVPHCLGESCSCPRRNSVAKYIYEAFKEKGGSVSQLLVFTTIAMHNMYLFCKFKEVNKSDVSFGTTCRGLLQLKEKKYYEALDKRTGGDYVKEPWKLDMFCRRSIYDEVALFKKCFYKKHCSGYVSLTEAVRLMNPEEAKNLTGTKSKREAKRELTKDVKLERRLQIYAILYNKIVARVYWKRK